MDCSVRASDWKCMCLGPGYTQDQGIASHPGYYSWLAVLRVDNARCDQARATARAPGRARAAERAGPSVCRAGLDSWLDVRFEFEGIEQKTVTKRP